jgi:Zn ribbon nucleic-acid-binding protein
MVFRCPSCREKIQIPKVTARDLPIVTCAHCGNVFRAPPRFHIGQLREANPVLYGILGIAMVLLLARLIL